MPELGKYAAAVLTSYAVSLLLLAGLAAFSLWRARRVRAALRKVEDRARRHG
ncbi:heme exporter protein CcmD [Pseudooceanicola sediminis]|uniref:Heme exporter protein D n=1 Tax=Pseudooceanicola sediminis TaxID=2211117 RepID=A0A399J2E4_9RHOB|nr:heme exporter protein CcmD [Puniceibacterium sp. HSS470]RII37116.1 heme exporter protein CcmD [Pseudooceanicola sediminis]